MFKVYFITLNLMSKNYHESNSIFLKAYRNLMVITNNKKELIIIGIDPGIRNTGWGVIKNVKGKLYHEGHGVIVPQITKNDAIRLNYISCELEKIINNYEPDLAVIEKIFVSASGESALKLGMARGVAMNLLASKNNIVIKEIAARFVKKAITGNGAADKIQINFMIEKLLGTKVTKLDASDALAIAIAGYNFGNENINITSNLSGKSLKKTNNNNKLNIAIQRALNKR